jgi:hypothetical protein
MLALAHSVECMIVAHKDRVRFPKSTKGEVAEFGLLRLFAKQVNPLKGFGGSNPFFTAKIYI